MAKKEKVYTYRKIKLSKKNGKFRDIYIPDESFKRHLNTLLKPLAYIYEKKHIYDCDHAFFKGRNCVTNASCHLKNRYILSLDIKDFFYHIGLPITLRRFFCLPSISRQRLLKAGFDRARST